MSLLETVIGGLVGGSGQSGSPLQSVLMNMLGGNSQNQSNPTGQYPTQQYGGGGGQMGGLGGLLGAFTSAGLGHIAQSWVSSGPNQPVSPDQLQSVFGQQRVEQMAQQSGMSQQDFLSQLSQHLPNAVDGMTPNGRLPDEGTVSV